MKDKGLVAVFFGSFCRSDPAAALRGFAYSFCPASRSLTLNSANYLRGKNTSPRTSMTSGHVRAPYSCADLIAAPSGLCHTIKDRNVHPRANTSG